MSVTILEGDVFERLAELPDESVHCVVTSPPYWGLRDYGVKGQLGLEPTLGEHIETMVRVFREVRRVLRKDGTCWINYGDCYATSPNGKSAAAYKEDGSDDRTFRDKPFSTVGPINPGKRIDRGSGRWGGGNNSDPELKPKDLCMVPNRLAIALQEDGWWVRSEIIWAKPNPMPESIKDRPATSHEKIWMLTKSARYFYDYEAVRTEQKDVSVARLDRANSGTSAPGQSPHTGVAGPRPNKKQKKQAIPAGWANDGPHTAAAWNKPRKPDKQRGHSKKHAGFNDRWDSMTKDEQTIMGANLRNVWCIATHAYPDAHFATFPPKLVERCIKAGCPDSGSVLDPFGGSGTTGLVADRLGRDAILIELNPKYCQLARKRIKDDTPLFTEVA